MSVTHNVINDNICLKGLKDMVYIPL